MMNINLSERQQDWLARQAAANGFASAEDYAVDLLALYAEIPYASDEAALRRSVASLEESHQQSLAGEGRDLREALRDIAAKNGLKIER